MRSVETRRAPVWLFVTAVLAGVACTKTTPDERDASAVLRHEIESYGNGLIRLASVRKTGGQRSALLGVTMYSLGYSADVVFLRDACYGGGLSARAYLAPHYDRSGMPASDALDGCLRVHVSRGERREVTGSLLFEQLDTGRWRGPDGRIY